MIITGAYISIQTVISIHFSRHFLERKALDPQVLGNLLDGHEQEHESYYYVTGEAKPKRHRHPLFHPQVVISQGKTSTNKQRQQFLVEELQFHLGYSRFTLVTELIITLQTRREVISPKFMRMTPL